MSEQALHQIYKGAEIKRLGEEPGVLLAVIRKALADDMAIGSEEDDRSRRREWMAAHVLENLDAIHARHLHIEHNKARLFPVNAPERLVAMVAGHRLYILVFEDVTHDPKDLRFIVDDDNLVLLWHTG